MMKITGKMSEKGADEAKRIMAEGFNFFLKAVGIGAAFALFFWKLPAIAEFILRLQQA